MLVALITDTHVGGRNDSLVFNDYFQKFYDTVFFPYLKANEIKRIIHLGDVFCRRKFVNFQILSKARDYIFGPLNEFQVDMITGNHDVAMKSHNKINSPDLLLRDYPNITVHHSPQTITIDGTDIAILPWVASGNYDECMQFIKDTPAQILMGHLELKGFQMYVDGKGSDTGFDPIQFSKFEMVCTGHFHHRSTRDNIYYLGAPYEMSWSDYADPKGFHILDTDTRELTFIPNPYRIYHKIHYDDTTMDIPSMINADYSSLEGTFVKLIVHSKTDPLNFERLVSEIEKARPIDLTFVDDTITNAFIEDLVEHVEDTPTLIYDSVNQAVLNQQFNPLVQGMMSSLFHEAISMSRV